MRQDGLFVPAWLGTASDIPGQVDLDVLQDALRAWTLRHETLRSGFRWVGDEMRRFTLHAESVVLYREDVGDFPDAATLTQYVLEGRGIETEPVASYVDFCATERANADQIDDTHAIVARWREFIAQCDGKLPNFPVDVGLDPEGPLPTQKFLHEMLVDDADAAAFEAYCRPYGGSLIGVLAATGLIVREISGQQVYRTVVPFHTRMKSQWSNSVGWYVGGAPIEIPVAKAPDFDTALEMVRAALRENRPLSRMPIARVLRLLGSDFRPTSGAGRSLPVGCPRPSYGWITGAGPAAQLSGGFVSLV